MTLHRKIACTSMLMVAASLVGCQTCQQNPVLCGEGHVCAADPYIIFIGADRDVGNWGKLSQVTEEFQACGYNAVYFDPWKQLHDHELLADWIRNAVRCRGRRVMLVGWSHGTVVGLRALDIVAREGIRVDTFVELDCINLNLFMGDDCHPHNADRVVVIRSNVSGNVVGYRNASVHRLDSYWHLGVPTHQHTQSVLRCEANRLRGMDNFETPSPSLPELSVSAPREDGLVSASLPNGDSKQ